MLRVLCGFLVVLCFTWGKYCEAQSLFGGSGGNTTATSGRSSTGSSSNRPAGSGGSGTSSSIGSNLFSPSSANRPAGTGSRETQGRSGAAGSTLTQTGLNAGDGSVAAKVGQSSFTGRSNTSNQFIGAQGSSGRGMGSNSQFSLLQGLVNNENFNANNANNTPAQSLTPQLKLGFVYTTLPAAELQTIVQTRLVALPALGARTAGVSATVDAEGMVVLSGIVVTEDDRLLMETLVRMEPGVRDVRNELKTSTSP